MCIDYFSMHLFFLAVKYSYQFRYVNVIVVLLASLTSTFFLFTSPQHMFLPLSNSEKPSHFSSAKYSFLLPQMAEATTDFALTKLKKSVENLGSSTQGYGDPTLMRFLIARSMDSDKAAKMFVQWQKWRTSMVPNGFISDSEVPDELETRKIFLQGLSKDKYPVMIVQASRHFPSKDQIQFKKFIVHLLDKTIASAFKGREVGNEKLIGVLDLQGISYKNVDARGLITGFQFLQSYYPERLAKCYILHMPWFFVSVWRFVSGFLDKATQEKIVIISNEEEKKLFVSDVGEDILPEEYGGREKLVPIQDVEVKPLENGRTT